MNEEQVTSLALAKELARLGVPQESLFYWVTTTLREDFHLAIADYFDTINTKPPASTYEDSGSEGDSWMVREMYSAFTVGEMGVLLPRCYMSWATPQNKHMKWWCRRMETHFVTHEETPIFTAETEADARAKMLINLKEQEQKE